MALISAAAFGTLAILAKLAYAAGMSVAQLLCYRFILATVGMCVLCLVTGNNPFAIPRRRLLLLGALGAGCYGGQSLLFFTALVYLPASLVELVLYAYPAFVVVGGWIVLRRRISTQVVIALVASLIGVGLLTGGVQFGFSPAIFIALAAPVAYTVYLFLAERAMTGQPPLAASTAVIAGAATFWFFAAALRGNLAPPTSGRAWLILATFVIVPSIIAIPFVLNALAAIGSERVSLLSTFEPLVTVLLAITLLRERLAILQTIGAALVLIAIVVLQWPAQRQDRASGGPTLQAVAPMSHE
jgi:drug/metabolite transporter (DMT)-like permease